jgi:hypothetical protein
MTSYYPTLSVITAAGFQSFRELYKVISHQGCQHDEYYTITYVDHLGNMQQLQVPVWKVMYNSIMEITRIRRR